MTVSKEFLTFKNRLRHFDDDIEMVDILCTTIKRNRLENGADKLFEYQVPEKHPNISSYSIRQENRLLLARHLRTTVYSSYVKDVYEEGTMYLRGIVSEAYQNATVDPRRIIGEHNINMSTVDVLAGIRDGTLAQTVIDNMFQTLENERSTIALIDKTCRKLGLNVDSGVVDMAVNYLEIRHKLVHTDGLADQEFKDTHPNLRYTQENYIDLTYQTILSMHDAVFALVKALDEDAISKHIINPNIAPTQTVTQT